MSKNSVDSAKNLLKRRQFYQVIRLLESNAHIYENDFEYNLTLGTAYLYQGDSGGALRCFNKAREQKFNNSNLLLGQGAIFLQRGESDRAIQYYLDVLDIDPNNKVAKRAMEFLRTDGDYSTICRMIDNKSIRKFYPSLGFNPDIIKNSIFGLIVVCAVCVFCCVNLPKIQKKANMTGPRQDISSLILSSEEKKNVKSADLSGVVVNYVLTDKEINQSYQKAMDYFQDGRDNLCQVELNRLLNSNASYFVKSNCNTLMSYLLEPTFDSLRDNFTYSQVVNDINLYKDCYVMWSGRFSNATTYDNGSWSCNLLVGYENLKNVEGIVEVRFDNEIVPALDGDKPVKFLGKICVENGEFFLKGIATYQPIKDN